MDEEVNNILNKRFASIGQKAHKVVRKYADMKSYDFYNEREKREKQYGNESDDENEENPSIWKKNDEAGDFRSLKEKVAARRASKERPAAKTANEDDSDSKGRKKTNFGMKKK